jgi:Zinc-finger double-stranded RNA-binding/Zinc-finger of C2H2 type
MAYCDRCARWFTDNHSLEQHISGSSFHWPCDDCSRDFGSSYALQEHYRQSPRHHYCRDCDRHFQNESNLRSHLNSRVHQPANLCCPGRGCNRSFISPGALTLHFEAGTCPSGMTREQLNRIVVRADTNNYITNPSRLLTEPLGWNEPPAPSTIWATERAWNGVAYECILCNSTFRTLTHLNRHLKSPRHADKIYRCPKSDCRIEFSTLSGLCQHVERGSCGVRMFRQVRDTIDSFTRGSNLLTA